MKAREISMAAIKIRVWAEKSKQMLLVRYQKKKKSDTWFLILVGEMYFQAKGAHM